GKRYLSKDPGNSPKVRTLHHQFPDAKFINLVRNPLQTIPSSISLFSYHCRTYGDPEEEYNLQETVIEQGKHWYAYPHQYLKSLPPDQYIRVQYRDLVSDPQGTIEKIYRQFGLEISPSFQEVLHAEAEKAKSFKSKHRYSLKQMGLSKHRIKKEFKDYLPPA
ncbi:MAG: sulfotransferase, partial [Anaerolineales bacterium]